MAPGSGTDRQPAPSAAGTPAVAREAAAARAAAALAGTAAVPYAEGTTGSLLALGAFPPIAVPGLDTASLEVGTFEAPLVAALLDVEGPLLAASDEGVFPLVLGATPAGLPATVLAAGLTAVVPPMADILPTAVLGAGVLGGLLGLRLRRVTRRA